jgi:transketolase
MVAMQFLRLFIVLTLIFSPYAGASFSLSDSAQANERVLSVATAQLMQISGCDSGKLMSDAPTHQKCADLCQISCCVASFLLIPGEYLPRAHTRIPGVVPHSVMFRSISESPEVHPPL